MLRDVLRAASSVGIMQEQARPYEAEVPGANGQKIRAQVFLPHEGLDELATPAEMHHWVFSAEKLAQEQGLGKVLRDWVAHPDVPDLEASQVVGLGLHCDGVQYTSTMRAGGAKSVVVMSWNCVSAARVHDRMKRRLFCVLAKDRLCNCSCSGFHTFQERAGQARTLKAGCMAFRAGVAARLASPRRHARARGVARGRGMGGVTGWCRRSAGQSAASRAYVARGVLGAWGGGVLSRRFGRFWRGRCSVVPR